MAFLVRYVASRIMPGLPLVSVCPRLLPSRCCSSKEAPYYDLHQYQPALTSAEMEYVLDKMNTATEVELASYSLPRSIIKRLILARTKREKFSHIKELLFIEGIGIKRVEKMLSKILKGDDDKKAKMKRANDIKKKIYLHPDITTKFQGNGSIVGLSCRNSFLAWCRLQPQVTSPATVPTTQPHTEESHINTTCNMLVDSSTSSVCSWHLTDLGFKKIISYGCDAQDLYNQVISAMDCIPESTVYVLSDKEITKSTSEASGIPTASALSHVTGLVATMLDARLHDRSLDRSNLEGATHLNRATEEPDVSVYYAKETQAVKAFVLQTPSKRLVGSSVTSLMLSGGDAGPWSRNVTIPPHCSALYSQAPNYEKFSLSSALFMALIPAQLQ